MEGELNIQWFPGHMAKARREVRENMKIVDAVCEIIDSRIPASSRNPDITEITGNKPRIIVMNRADQADPAETEKWREFYRGNGRAVLETDCASGKGCEKFTGTVRTLLRDKLEAWSAKGVKGKTLRVMVLGIPNVGKSSFINRMTRRRAAEVSDRPGVTRGRQWVNLGNNVELLDTPGLLWPKFEDRRVGENLAFTGAIKDDILDVEALAALLVERLRERYGERIRARYSLETVDEGTGLDILTLAARKRGFLVTGGEPDTERMAKTLLDEFRGGKLGRITLERLEEYGQLGD